MEDTWVKYMRSDQTKELLQEPLAFTLLSLIANRARRTDAFNKYGLTVGQALIGDFKAIGMTRQQYRTALSKLVKWHFVTTKATTKGTIVTIIDKTVYDINFSDSNQQTNQTATNKQPSSNQRATTNKNVKKDNNDKNEKKKRGNFVPPTVIEVLEYSKEINYPLNADAFINSYAQKGWMVGKNKMKCWKSAVRNWKSNGWGKTDTPAGNKTKLFPIPGKVCSKSDCRMPAVYKNDSGAYDTFYCTDHMPEAVRKQYA